jgi:hypothetical protein
LRKFRGDASNIRPLHIANDEEEEVYEVEEIVGECIRKNKVEFLVKWHGYPEDEMPWEPEEHLHGAQDDGLESAGGTSTGEANARRVEKATG